MQAPREQTSGDDVERAAEVVGANLRLLTGHDPGRHRLVTGHSHVHRLALVWPVSAQPRVCVQLLADAGAGSAGEDVSGWASADARAVAESLDLRMRCAPVEHRTSGFNEWRRATGLAYHLVLLDSGRSPERDRELNRRCALLEAGYLDGAGWLRFYADGRFAEGSFDRVLERAAFDIRSRLGSPATHSEYRGARRGLC